MAPRLQCLNALRTFRCNARPWKAALSTTARAPAADDRPSFSPFSSLNNAEATRATYSPTTVDDNPNSSSNARAQNLIDQVPKQRPAAFTRDSMGEKVWNERRATELGDQISRRWRVGDVYAPHDLSSAESNKWRKRSRPGVDVFDMLDINPLEEYKNFAMMSEYMTPMGRIKSSSETGLRRVNQRRIAKAIRRSIGLGLMPSVHRHPEILYRSRTKVVENIRGLKP